MKGPVLAVGVFCCLALWIVRTGPATGRYDFQDITSTDDDDTLSLQGSVKDYSQSDNSNPILETTTKISDSTRPLYARTNPTLSTTPFGPMSDSWQAWLAGVAVVVIGGQNRTDNLQAAFDTWTTAFPRRLFLTDADPATANVTSELAAHMINIYSGYSSDREKLGSVAHPEHPFLASLDQPALRQSDGASKSSLEKEVWAKSHGIGWHLSQPKYLLGLLELQRRFPEARWSVSCVRLRVQLVNRSYLVRL